MADESRRLTDLLEEIIEEAESGELDPENDLSWENHDDYLPDFESGYHE